MHQKSSDWEKTITWALKELLFLSHLNAAMKLCRYTCRGLRTEKERKKVEWDEQKTVGKSAAGKKRSQLPKWENVMTFSV